MLARKCIFALLLVCLFSASSQAARADETPMERVKVASNELIEILSDPDIKNPDEHDKSIARLRATAEKYIDFRLVTMYSVGKKWLKMTPQMQADLTEAFIQLLERTYLQRIPAYEGQKIEYKNETVSGKKAKVLVEIIDKDKKIVVEFRLRMVQEKWMIYDMTAEGVSLVSNYRSQFAEVLNDGTAEELLEQIRARIKKLDEEATDGDQAES